MSEAVAAPAAPASAPSAQVDNQKQTGKGEPAIAGSMAKAVAAAPGSPQNQGNDAEVKAEAEKVRRTLRWKDGDQEGEYDLDNPEHLARAQREFQLAKASDRKFQEAARMREEAARDREMLRDPKALMEILKAQGVDFDALATDRLYEKMQLEAMNPDQRARMEAEQKLQAMESQAKQAEQAREQAETQAFEEGYGKWMDQNLTKALADLGMPKSPYLIGLAAHKIRSAAKAQIDLSPQDAAAYAKEEAGDHLKQLMAALPEDKILEILGEEFGVKISRHMANRIRGVVGQPKPQPARQQGQRPQTKSEKMDPAEWREHLRSLV